MKIIKTKKPNKRWNQKRKMHQMKLQVIRIKDRSEVVQDLAPETGEIEERGHLAMIKVWNQEKETIAEEVEIDLQEGIVSTTPKGTEVGIEIIGIKTAKIGAVELIIILITAGENTTRDHKKRTVDPRTFISDITLDTKDSSVTSF